MTNVIPVLTIKCNQRSIFGLITTWINAAEFSEWTNQGFVSALLYQSSPTLVSQLNNIIIAPLLSGESPNIQRMLLTFLHFIPHVKASCILLIRITTTNSDYRLHNIEAPLWIVHARNRSQKYGTEDDGFSIELRTFNSAEYSARFAALEIYFRQKWNTNFTLSVHSSIQAMQRCYRESNFCIDDDAWHQSLSWICRSFFR